MPGFEEGSHPRDDHGRFAAGEGEKHAKAAEKSYGKAQEFVSKARDARAMGDQKGFDKHMATATKHIQAGDSSRSKANAAGATGLQGFVYKHGGEKTAAPAAPPAAAPKSALGAFTEKHAAPVAKETPKAPSVPKDGNHPELHAAIDEVNKAGRHGGLVPVSDVTKNLVGKGWSREEAHRALLDMRAKGKGDLKVSNNPRFAGGHSTGSSKGVAPADDPDVIKEKDIRLGDKSGANTMRYLSHVTKY